MLEMASILPSPFPLMFLVHGVSVATFAALFMAGGRVCDEMHQHGPPSPSPSPFDFSSTPFILLTQGARSTCSILARREGQARHHVPRDCGSADDGRERAAPGGRLAGPDDRCGRGLLRAPSSARIPTGLRPSAPGRL